MSPTNSRVKHPSGRGWLASALATVLILAAAGPTSARDETEQGALLSRASRVRQQAAWCDLNLLLLRLNSGFWANWAGIDSTLEGMFLQQYPEASSRLTWKDPGSRLLSAGWLLSELARNVEFLVVLGRSEDARRILVAAEKLAAAATARRQPLDVLLVNTMARLLLVGWRDSADPVSDLESQVDNSVRNIVALRTALRSKDTALRTLPIPGGLAAFVLEAALSRRSSLLLHGVIVGAIAGFPRVGATFFSVVDPSLPVLGGATPERHAVAADEAALALNLPFTLVPVGAELERFLADHEAGLVPGNAVLLGAGDGGEALRVARVSAIESVFSVDHAQLASERALRATSRLRHLPEVSRIVVTRADVREASFPDRTVSLVVASHLLEYLDPSDRQALYERISHWMKPGGTVFFLVHADEGDRLESLLNGVGNASGVPEPAGLRLTVSSLIPARPDANEVKRFLSPTAFRDELLANGLGENDGFSLNLRVAPAPGGFVEIAAILSLVNR